MPNLTTAQAAAHLKISAARVRVLCANGLLPAQKVGRDWVITQEAVDAYEPRGPGRPSNQQRALLAVAAILGHSAGDTGGETG